MSDFDRPRPTPTALVVIDVQESFRHRPYFRADDLPAYFGAQNLLVEGFAGLGLPIVRVLHVEPDGPFSLASGLVEPMAELAAFEPALRFEKGAHSAFSGTPAPRWLTERGIARVAVSGIRTEQCCETTTRDGSDRGFQIDFVSPGDADLPDAPPGRARVQRRRDPRADRAGPGRPLRHRRRRRPGHRPRARRARCLAGMRRAEAAPTAVLVVAEPGVLLLDLAGVAEPFRIANQWCEAAGLPARLRAAHDRRAPARAHVAAAPAGRHRSPAPPPAARRLGRGDRHQRVCRARARPRRRRRHGGVAAARGRPGGGRRRGPGVDGLLGRLPGRAGRAARRPPVHHAPHPHRSSGRRAPGRARAGQPHLRGQRADRDQRRHHRRRSISRCTPSARRWARRQRWPRRASWSCSTAGPAATRRWRPRCATATTCIRPCTGPRTRCWPIRHRRGRCSAWPTPPR